MRGTTLVLAALITVAGCGLQPTKINGVPLADGSDSSVSAAIDAITRFPTELDQRLFNGTDLKPEIREMTLRIVDRIVSTSGIPNLTVDAVELFGSDASYEYDDASDFGVHVFTHSTSLEPGLLSKMLRLLNDEVERRQEGHITFNGIPVEVTFHGERTENYRPTPGIGLFSVSQNRWIEKPVKQPDNFDRTRMAADMHRFIDAYNDLARSYAQDKKGFDCQRFDKLDKEMGAYRNSAFANGSGSRSTQNLAYRGLRRININIPDELDRLEDECIFGQESIG